MVSRNITLFSIILMIILLYLISVTFLQRKRQLWNLLLFPLRTHTKRIVNANKSMELNTFVSKRPANQLVLMEIPVHQTDNRDVDAKNPTSTWSVMAVTVSAEIQLDIFKTRKSVNTNTSADKTTIAVKDSSVRQSYVRRPLFTLGFTSLQLLE